MFAHLKVRTGMIGVLVLFVIALMFSIVNSWSSAVRSYDQVDELRHTSQQIDGINNSLLLAIRTSANVSSAFIETVGGRFEDALPNSMPRRPIFATRNFKRSPTT